MATTIAVAGATGQLGGMIVNALLERGAQVCALVRAGTASDKLAELERPGIKIAPADLANVSELTRACAGASCVVSALQGLRDVIVDAQSVLLHAAIVAGVPRFIPSDFSADFTKLSTGENRNFDLRRTFHERLDKSSIAATSIFNGAFAELLTSRMPLLDFDARRVSYWENAEQRLDFTTMANVAAFTAAAALDPSTPRILRIAGDQKRARAGDRRRRGDEVQVRARPFGQSRRPRRTHQAPPRRRSRKREVTVPGLARDAVHAQHVQRPRQTRTARQRSLPQYAVDQRTGGHRSALNWRNHVDASTSSLFDYFRVLPGNRSEHRALGDIPAAHLEAI
jgi:hypothetical protein